MRADVVFCGREESHGHLFDLCYVDKGSLLHSLEPLVSKLLKPVFEAIHCPVLLRLDGLALLACVFGVKVTESTWEIRADCLEILGPGRAVDGVYTYTLELHYGFVGVGLGKVRDIGYEARGQLYHLVDVVDVES